MNIIVTIKDKQVEVPAYTTCEDILRLTGLIDTQKDQDVSYLSNPIIGAFVGGQLMPLGYHVPMSCDITPVKAFEHFGRRIYRHSICFLLSYATKLVFPKRHLVIGHALGDGYYFSFDDEYDTTKEQIQILDAKMRELSKAAIPVEYSIVSTPKALEILDQEGYSDTKLLIQSRNDPYVKLYKIRDYYHISFEPLVYNTSIMDVWDLRKYGSRGMLLRYPTSSSITTIAPFRDNPKLFSVFEEYKQWGRILKVRCLGEMNQKNNENSIEEYVRLSENLQRRKLASVADQIVEKKAKVVFVAGPSSSGKTTFAKKLCEQLMLLGNKPIRISLDNYYKKREFAPLDEDGKPDLEALEALDVDLFKQNMKDLLEGKAVDLPQFSFAKNCTYYLNRPITMADNTIFVIEGIHGLNPKITCTVDENYIFKVYISALTQLNMDDCNRVSTTDNRILRRIIRDNRTRATSAEETLLMWPSVSRGEKTHIFPNQNNADVMFNSALDYEIGVLSPYAQPLLREVRAESGYAYTEARRLLQFLENIYPIPSKYVPSDSILREFIGQSDYEKD